MSSHVAELGTTPYQTAILNLIELKERRERLAEERKRVTSCMCPENLKIPWFGPKGKKEIDPFPWRDSAGKEESEYAGNPLFFYRPGA